MLKRNGESCQYTVPGFAGKLNRGEMDAYTEAFEAIQEEFDSLQKIKDSLKELMGDPVVFRIPDGQSPNEEIETPNTREGTVRWQVRSRLLTLNQSDVLLCERLTRDGKEFAVIDRFNSDSPYGNANGAAQVHLTGNDPVLLVQDYAANAEHTLRFMASNMVATAQKIVWRRYASSSPDRVVRAISERCAAVVSNAHDELQAHAFERRQQRKQTAGQRV
jgi:hypothetical protein